MGLQIPSVIPLIIPILAKVHNMGQELSNIHSKGMGRVLITGREKLALIYCYNTE